MSYYRKINLPNKQGKKLYALVDNEDYDYLVSMGGWSLSHGYAQTSLNGTTVRMHKIVTKTSTSQIIDHINGNPLDNRKSNLRTCKSTENSWNRSIGIRNKSGYKGVCWKSSIISKPWCAYITKEGKVRHLGYFEKPELAAQAYNEAARELFGEFANLNRGVLLA